MFHNRSLAVKLVVAILASTGLIFIVVLLYNYFYTKEAIRTDMQQDARNISRGTAWEIESKLNPVEKVPTTLAAMLEAHDVSEDELSTVLRAAVEASPEVYGASVAFEPYAFDGQKLYFMPYAFHRDGSVVLTYLGSNSYNYFALDWYQIPREMQKASWSEPYYDEGGGDIIMATYSVPFFREAGGGKILRGVVTADVALSWLKDAISSVRLYDNGYAFLVSRTGRFITHKKTQLIMRESIFSLAEDRNDGELRKIGRRMIAGEEGLVPVKDFITGEDSWMYFTPLTSSGASLGVIVPEDELFARVRSITTRLFSIGAIGFLSLFCAIVFVSGRITRPIKLLSRKALELAKGNLDVDLPAPGSEDEIGMLNQSFMQMRRALKEYIADLAATTRAKERIESELKIARAIQMSFLPKRFPPFPDQASFDIFASLEPAREVGGDLYDFFLVGNEHLFFTIGDVSGKGVPAALFMAVSKTLIKGTCEPGVSPSEVLNRVNFELCQENDANMFVTVFAGLLNFRTGELQYANGGHNPPLLLRSGGRIEWLDVGKSVVLGAFEKSVYQTKTTVLEPGEGILLYTDGITEAQNANADFYTDERLHSTISRHFALSPAALVRSLIDDVKLFGGDAPQADDMAVLAIRRLEGV